MYKLIILKKKNSVPEREFQKYFNTKSDFRKQLKLKEVIL
jgi:hypothetical protein